jgi:hypothetical protein
MLSVLCQHAPSPLNSSSRHKARRCC